jgi:C4-dicarboxylate-specific signal transduction histidine kinase
VLQDAALAELVEGVLLLLAPLAAAAGARLESDVAAELTAQCDPVQIEQLLANLVRNALDALNGVGAGHKTCDGIVRVSARRTPSGIALRVEDNGPGFPADMESRPLETFFTTKDAGSGTGLGLSICHMIARAHAGSLVPGNHAGGAFVELNLPSRRLAP